MTTMLVSEDGEIIGHINPGDRIVRKASIDHLEETIEWGKGWDFVKTFKVNFLKASSELSGTSVAVMHILSNYIAYQSNLLCNRSCNNPLNNQDIQAITGFSIKTVGKIMDELVTKKVFARTFVGKSYLYYANPYIYCCGSKINKTLETTFKDYPERFK